MFIVSMMQSQLFAVVVVAVLLPVCSATSPQTACNSSLELLVQHPHQLLDGWIVFQRRVNGDIDFYRDWKDYKMGFGDFSGGDFWLGNDMIHQLSSSGKWSLRVEFVFEGRPYYAEYSTFSVAGEEDNYRLTVGGYSGNAGDSLTVHNGMEFSTYDRDNDRWRGPKVNCAKDRHGAWWYKGCGFSNLNGLWGAQDYSNGVNWYYTTGSRQSATSTMMKMRPVP